MVWWGGIWAGLLQNGYGPYLLICLSIALSIHPSIHLSISSAHQAFQGSERPTVSDSAQCCIDANDRSANYSRLRLDRWMPKDELLKPITKKRGARILGPVSAAIRAPLNNVAIHRMLNGTTSRNKKNSCAPRVAEGAKQGIGFCTYLPISMHRPVSVHVSADVRLYTGRYVDRSMGGWIDRNIDVGWIPFATPRK